MKSSGTIGGSRQVMAGYLEKLDQEWLEGGFLHKLRDREFDPVGYVRLENILNGIRQLDDQSNPLIDRQLVRLLWFIPQFMEWQTERVINAGADARLVNGACSNIREMVGIILGEP